MPAPGRTRTRACPTTGLSRPKMAPDLVVAPVLPEDERVWVPQAPNVWFRPLCLSTRRRATGSTCSR